MAYLILQNGPKHHIIFLTQEVKPPPMSLSPIYVQSPSQHSMLSIPSHAASSPYKLHLSVSTFFGTKIDPLPSQINSQVVEDFYWMYPFPKVHLFLILLFMGCILIGLKFKILYMLNWHFKVLFHLKYFWSIRMYYL